MSTQSKQPSRIEAESRDLPPSRDMRPRRQRSQIPFYLPQRCYTPSESPSYNRIIRLEGQILALISILRFHLVYAPYSVDHGALDSLRLVSLPIYFNVIEELVGHMEHGCDLNYQRSAGDLVYMAQKRWFPRVVRQYGEEEAEVEGHWPRILWLAQLQRMLEDESLSLGGALRKGWEWYVDVEGFPVRYAGQKECALGWAELDTNQQEQFLGLFKVDANALRAIAQGVHHMTLKGLSLHVHEKYCCVQIFEAQKRMLDVETPRMVNPSKQKLGTCTICDVPLLKEDVGTNRTHRPVEIPCGHIFGSSCIEKHFLSPKIWSCSVCAKNLYHYPHHPRTPTEVVQGCDRTLKWLDPRTSIVFSEGPHSYLEKLTLIFELADTIRRNLGNWPAIPEASYAESLRLQDLMLYLTRDRLDAANKGETARYREVVAQQLQVAARWEWLQFWGGAILIGRRCDRPSCNVRHVLRVHHISCRMFV